MLTRRMVMALMPFSGRHCLKFPKESGQEVKVVRAISAPIRGTTRERSLAILKARRNTAPVDARDTWFSTNNCRGFLPPTPYGGQTQSDPLQPLSQVTGRAT